MRNWTEAQRRAIETQGNLIVSAAAGAGKTAVLTERLTRIVASGTPVDRLLVLTFTRAAAAEMKQRIEKNLRDAAARAQTAEQQAYLRAQAGAIGRAYISTIDAFCARVLRRHGHRIDLPPAMRVLDELEAPVLSERVKDALLTAFGAEENAHWRALLAAFGSEDAAWASPRSEASERSSAALEGSFSTPSPSRYLLPSSLRDAASLPSFMHRRMAYSLITGPIAPAGVPGGMCQTPVAGLVRRAHLGGSSGPSPSSFPPFPLSRESSPISLSMCSASFSDATFAFWS